MTTSVALAAAYPSFDAIRTVKIPSLDVAVAEYRHRETGAIHYHLASSNTENVFLVALRTMPMDSTGVAHILEHTALCGSKKFPVRDPFFLMIRRSLNTFMNAFTSSDWTAYPFASQNRKDFDNLLSVYLDAVFFANLNPLDFSQEGIRVEFEKEGDATSPLVYKGVVFNEMKGAMSSAHAELWEAVNSQLFPTTTYHYNSGGDPATIPTLSYEQLLEFYKRHYHPSNAVFMTYGDIPAIELQERFENEVLKNFTALSEQITGHDEVRYQEPQYAEASFALDEEESASKTHLMMAWLLGKTANLKERFESELLSGVLLENSASPLRHYLETSGLGQAPSPYVGVDDSSRELTFLCGIEGSEPEQRDAFEKGVLEVLQKVAVEGVPLADVEAVLHQLEFSRREISGDGMPYGLQLILGGLGAVLHDGDPVALWDIDAVLIELREAIKDPNYIPSLVKKWLLDNTHRVTLTFKPDVTLSQARRDAEKAELAAKHRQLSPEAIEQIHRNTQALQERQNQEDDVELLPRVGREDIPSNLHIAEGQTSLINIGKQQIPLTRYSQGTNGLVYEQLVIDLPALTPHEQTLLPLYTSLVSELGAGKHDYLAMQQWQSQVSGGLGMSFSMRADLQNVQKGTAHLVFSGKALSAKADDFNELMCTTLETLRFDERDRVRERVARMKLRWEASVTGQGHALAMQTASASFGVIPAFQQRTSGMMGIRSIKLLDERLANEEALDELLAQLKAIHQKVIAAPRQFLLIGEENQLATLEKSVETQWASALSHKQGDLFQFDAAESARSIAWLANTQVQFCARSYGAVALAHSDAPALMLLGGFLKNGFLHGAIREKGGAYGGGAAYDSNAGAFRFYSYRDPRLAETLSDFDASIQWLLNEKHDQRQLEEALLGVISDMDKPLSPAGEAKSAFHSQLYGRTPEQRRQLRQKLLEVSLKDLQQVGERYLTGTGVTAVVAPMVRADDVQKLGLDIERL